MMKKRIIFALVLITLPYAAVAATSDYTIIANPKVGSTSISHAELKSLMFGHKTTFGGVAIEPCLWGSKEGETFFSGVLGVSKTQFNQEWVKKELTGAGRAPKSRESIDDVIACVGDNKGGLGFIPNSSAAKAEGKVKVLSFND